MNHKPPATSSQPPTASSTGSETFEHLEYAARRARLLFGCYRKAEANDPDTYVTAVGAVLAEFEPEVIRRVTDLVHGIPRKFKWLPQIAELAEECERVAGAVNGQRILAQRAAQGFRWIDDGANGRVGFYNERGEKYGRQRSLPAK